MEGAKVAASILIAEAEKKDEIVIKERVRSTERIKQKTESLSQVCDANKMIKRLSEDLNVTDEPNVSN